MAIQLEAMLPGSQDATRNHPSDAPTGPLRMKRGGERRISKAGQEDPADPVTAYLSKIGEVRLLNRAGEQRVARDIEEGTWEVFDALLSLPTDDWSCSVVRRPAMTCSPMRGPSGAWRWHG